MRRTELINAAWEASEAAKAAWEVAKSTAFVVFEENEAWKSSNTDWERTDALRAAEEAFQAALEADEKAYKALCICKGV